MEKKYFNIYDVLTYSWHVMACNFGLFVRVGLMWLLLSYIQTFAAEAIISSGISDSLMKTYLIILRIVSAGIGLLILIGFIKIALSFCDEYRPPATTLFDAHGCYWKCAGVTILYLLIIALGLLLFIIPGIYWAIKFSFCQFFVVEKGLTPLEALKASAKATKSAQWDLLGLNLICVLINAAGMLCLGIGIIITYPITFIAKVLTYRQMVAQTHELSQQHSTQQDPDSHMYQSYQ